MKYQAHILKGPCIYYLHALHKLYIYKLRFINIIMIEIIIIMIYIYSLNNDEKKNKSYYDYFGK